MTNQTVVKSSPLKIQTVSMFDHIASEQPMVFRLIEENRSLIEGTDVILNSFITKGLVEKSYFNKTEETYEIEPKSLRELLLEKFDNNTKNLVTNTSDIEVLETFLSRIGYKFDDTISVSVQKDESGKISNGRMVFSNGKRRINSEFYYNETQFLTEGKTPKYIYRCIKHAAHVGFLMMRNNDKMEYMKEYGIPYGPRFSGIPHHQSTLFVHQIYQDGKFDEFMNRAGYEEITLLSATNSAWRVRGGLYTDPDYFWVKGNYNHSEPINIPYNLYGGSKEKVEIATMLTVWRRLQTHYTSTAHILHSIGYELSEISKSEMNRVKK